MDRRRLTQLGRLVAVAAGLSAIAGCTDATLGLVPEAPTVPKDDRLELTGTFCTEPAADTAFPVKILFLIDQSNSMCYSDPASGACTTARCDQGPNNPGTNQTPPRRARAVQEILDRYAGNDAVSYGIITFSAGVQAFPYDATNNPKVAFTTDRAALRLERLRNVDSVTDYQGALSRAKNIISDDLQQVLARRRSELPRTKYAVILLTDGAPFPRCSATDPARNNPPNSPVCGSQPPTCTICQNGGRPNSFPGLKANEDYNEPYQLIQVGEELHRLGEAYGVGDLKLHTALLRVDNAAQCCPDCFTDDPDGTVAEGLLTAMAMPEKGFGSFTRFTRTEDLSFVDYDFTSLRQPFAARSLVPDPENLVPHAAGAKTDTDGDGLDDDTEFRLGTNRLAADADGDGYRDFIEVSVGGALDPLTPQPQRCKDRSLKCPDRRPCDTDGDGLRDCEEAELGTDPEFVDSDADGLPDGLEVRRGLDPLRDDRHEDLDFDGATNLEEVLRFTSPTERDARGSEADRVQASFEVSGTGDGGRTCYDLDVRQLRLPTTLSREPDGLPLGWSDTLLWVGEAPKGDLRDFGRFRVACVRARFVTPSVRLPLQPGVALKDSDFHDPADFDRARDCVGADP